MWWANIAGNENYSVTETKTVLKKMRTFFQFALQILASFSWSAAGQGFEVNRCPAKHRKVSLILMTTVVHRENLGKYRVPNFHKHLANGKRVKISRENTSHAVLLARVQMTSLTALRYQKMFNVLLIEETANMFKSYLIQSNWYCKVIFSREGKTNVLGKKTSQRT